jgi:hypothetical protein
MNVVTPIKCDNGAFAGGDCGNELARFLRLLPDHFEFESKSTITKRDGVNPKRLGDSNSQTVGSLELTRVVYGEKNRL